MNCDACGLDLFRVEWYGVQEEERLCPDCYSKQVQVTA